MRRFFYDSEIKEFSDKSIAEKHLSIIDQIYLHLLKLEYRLNYKYDRDKHIRDISEWMMDIRIAINKDKTAKGIHKVLPLYLQLENIQKKIPKWQSILRNDYGFKGIIMMDIIDDLSNLIIAAVSYGRTKEEIEEFLRRQYPYGK